MSGDDCPREDCNKRLCRACGSFPCSYQGLAFQHVTSLEDHATAQCLLHQWVAKEGNLLMELRPRKGNTRSLECHIPKTRYFTWQHSVILYVASWSILVLLQVCHYFMRMTGCQANDASSVPTLICRQHQNRPLPAMRFPACSLRHAH